MPDAFAVHTAHVPLMDLEQIARFRDLQELDLWFLCADSRYLDPLCDLKCLTMLILAVFCGIVPTR